MRQFIIQSCALFALLVSSCSEKQTAINEDVSLTNPYYRTYSEALDEAFAIMNDPDTRTRSHSLEVLNHYEYILPMRTRASSGTDMNGSFHVINFKDDQGYVMVSGDKRVTPVFAFSHEGHLNLEDAIQNTGFSEFMDESAAYYLYEINRFDDTKGLLYPQFPQFPENGEDYLQTAVWNGEVYYIMRYNKTIDSTNVLLTTEWDQCDPYNYYCPQQTGGNYLYQGRAAAGCGPIAASQIIAYHRFPSQFEDVYGNTQTLDWNLIHSQPSYSYNEHTSASLETAKLIYHVGLLSQANYGTSTSTSNGNIVATFADMGYSSSNVLTYADEDSIKISIKRGRPVYARGNRLGAIAGHAWVIDGFYSKEKTTAYFTYEAPHLFAFEIGLGLVNTYYHCNWGWGGLYNGYVLHFQAGDDYQYNIMNAYIINIHPQN
jgi:hypothetical protein